MDDAQGSKAKQRILLAAGVGITLLLAEAVCRFALPRPGFIPRHGSWLPGAVRPHPTRGYALVPGFSARVTAEEAFGSMHIAINAEGLREQPLETLRAADLRILAVGDSFTFGFGLEAEQAWPDRLEVALHTMLPARSLAVINAGVPGYNLAQMDEMVREMLARTAPQLIIAAVYVGGFDRMLNPLTTLGDLVIRSSELRVVRLVGGGLVRSSFYNQTVVDLDLWLKTHWYFGAWLFDGAFEVFDRARGCLSEAAGEPAPASADGGPFHGVAEGLEALARLQRRARDAGVPLVVLVVASFEPDHRTTSRQRLISRELARFGAAAGIPVVDPTEALQEADIPLRVRPSDYHWSAAAYEVVAGELAAALLDQCRGRTSPARGICDGIPAFSAASQAATRPRVVSPPAP